MKNVVVVESPSKTKKLASFLGKDYEVISSVGHVRDLPKSGLGVDVENDFEPEYVISPDKKDVVKDLKKYAKDADAIYLATDLDREGEAIAWHVAYLMNNEDYPIDPDEKNANYQVASKVKNKSGKNPQVYRVTFNSITKDAVLEGFKEPRKLDMNLIDAQQGRRILDRLVGYKLSPLLWEKIRYGLSAGRVQSVAVRFIVEREREIKGFSNSPYFEILGVFSKDKSKKEQLAAKLIKIDEHSIYKKEKFKLFAGEYTASKTTIDSEGKAKEILSDLAKSTFKIEKVESKDIKSHPSPPFSTATLQQAASSNLGYSPSRTMQLAQKLYEGGYITYMRTDSIYINPATVNEIRKLIKKDYGDRYGLPHERFFKGKKTSRTQEAHEAIRPTNVSVRADALPASINPQQRKLYELIWRRSVACQMAPAVFGNTKVYIQNENNNSVPVYTLEAKGSVVKFDGYLRVYSNKRKEEILPEVHEGDVVNLKESNMEQKEMAPPPRYNESSLVRELESFSIGRPSTYASIISTIQTRGYVKKIEKSLYPTDNGVVVNDLLTNHFPQIVDVDFTAEMEDSLDEVAEGELEWRKLIADFYGPFESLVSTKKKEIKKEDVVVIEKTDESCPECKEGQLIVKLGKFGKFLSCNRYPDCKYARPLETEETAALDSTNEENGVTEEIPDLNEKCPECGGKLVIKDGRFGKFIACENYPKCKYTKAILKKAGIKCPKCGDSDGGEVVMKKTKRGKIFFGCSRYPKCDYASWTKPGVGEKLPVKTSKTKAKSKSATKKKAKK